MNKIILFDLANTLLYRENSLRHWDMELCASVLKENVIVVHNALDKFSNIYSGIYYPSIHRFENLTQEDSYVREYFFEVVKFLKKDLKLVDSLCDKRAGQVRYKLYNGVKQLLNKLSLKGYGLGVASNGRPSRRRVLIQLGIWNLFDPNLVYISDEIGMVKPGKQFYEFVSTKNLNRKIYLCDDDIESLKFAALIGWKTFHINHTDKGFLPIKLNLLKSV